MSPATAKTVSDRLAEPFEPREVKFKPQTVRANKALAIAYVDAYADIPSFRARDQARVGLVELVQGIMDGREANPPADKDERDLLDVLMSLRTEDGSPHFSADEVTGMFISCRRAVTIFASSCIAATLSPSSISSDGGFPVPYQ